MTPTDPAVPPPLFLSTQEGYDRWSDVYDSDGNPLLPLEEPQVAGLLGDIAGLSILDVGCGTGRHAVRLAASGARVTAVDFSPGMLARAFAKQDAADVRFLNHDLTQPLPLPDASFDRAVCCLVLDHIERPARLLSDVRRVLRPGGFLVVSVMHPALLLAGVQARFTHPENGQKVCPQSYPHQISDYLMAALAAGLRLCHISEHAATADYVAQVPRAARYAGWPLLLMLKLARDDASVLPNPAGC